MSISTGATETIHPASAQSVKNPSERKMSQMEKPIRSGSLPTGKCVAAAQPTERNHPQQMPPNKISHTVWRAIIASGRKRTPGCIRRKAKLRPNPEITIHASAASGISQRSSCAISGSYFVTARLNAPAASHGFEGSMLLSPDSSGVSIVKTCCNRDQHASRNGTPKSHRHPTSTATMAGRLNIRPI